MDFRNRLRSTTLFSAAMTLLIGIIFVTDPIGAQVTIIRVIGAYVGASGIIRLVSYFMNKSKGLMLLDNPVTAGILIILGLFLLIRPVVLLSFFSYIFCFVLILSGISGVGSALSIRGNGLGGWQGQLIIFGLVLVAGIIMLFVPLEAVAFSSAIIGTIFIVAGVLQLVAWFRMGRIPKE